MENALVQDRQPLYHDRLLESCSIVFHQLQRFVQLQSM